MFHTLSNSTHFVIIEQCRGHRLLRPGTGRKGGIAMNHRLDGIRTTGIGIDAGKTIPGEMTFEGATRGLERMTIGGETGMNELGHPSGSTTVILVHLIAVHHRTRRVRLGARR